MKKLSREKLLKLMTAFCSDDETRPELRGIYFDPDRPWAVATDGFGMATSGKDGLYDPALAGLTIDPRTMSVIRKGFPKWATIFPLKLNQDRFSKLNIDKGLGRSFIKARKFGFEKTISGHRPVVLSYDPLEPQPEWAYSGEVILPMFEFLGGRDDVMHCIYSVDEAPRLAIRTPQVEMLFMPRRNSLYEDGGGK